MEHFNDQSDYLTANSELINILRDDVDRLIRTSDASFKVRKDSEDNDAYLVEGEAQVDEATEDFNRRGYEYTLTEEDIESFVDSYNQQNQTIASLNINFVHAFVSMHELRDMTDEFATQQPENDLIDYDDARCLGARISPNLWVSHTTMNGIKGNTINDAEEVSIDHVSDDGLLRKRLSVLYLNGNLSRISLDYSPVQDEQIQEWAETMGDEHSAELFTFIASGIRETEEESESRLGMLEYQLLSEGLDENTVLPIIDGLRDRIIAIKKDIDFKVETNISEPSVDDLMEFYEILKKIS